MLRQELLGIEHGFGTEYTGIHDVPASNPDLLQSWLLLECTQCDVSLTVADQTCLNGQFHIPLYAILLLAATP
jgi:hypothetical protein